MGWEMQVLDRLVDEAFQESGPAPTAIPATAPGLPTVQADTLASWLAEADHPDLAIVDRGPRAAYARQHIPGAWFAMRSDLAEALAKIPKAGRYVLSCNNGHAARYAVEEVAILTGSPSWLLQGGNQAWIADGGATETGEQRLASLRMDRYRRPWEGTDSPREAMQGYLDWEFGRVEQLRSNGTHGFKVI